MELNELRTEIDAVDDKIAALFKERMKLVKSVAEVKKAQNTGVLNKKRENEILSRVCKNEEHEIYLRILFTGIFDLSRSYQSILCDNSKLKAEIETALAETPELFPTKGTIACQGTNGSYSSKACGRLFPMTDIMFFSNFEAVFNSVETGLCDYGVLPLENSSYGSVGEVYDLMRTKDFHIVKSIKLHVHHCLLAKSDTMLSDIKEIISHEQALGQCSEFLRSLKNVKITAVDNTAKAAEIVSKSADNSIAAIASENCAENYGLKILNERVANTDNNQTRFICISKKAEIYPGSNKISLMLCLPHEPGSLYRLIGKFAALGLNLNKLESRPIIGKNFEFMFYFDFEASVADKNVVALLSELSEENKSFVFLGNYLEVN